MTSEVLRGLGIDPGWLIILLFLLQVILFCLLISINMKYHRLKKSYASFMKGKDGKTLEKSILVRFRDIDKLLERMDNSEKKIGDMNKALRQSYQKKAIVRYDAFQEMGGKLSFVLTMLNEDNSGWIFNAMHTREGCYTYIKEVIKGESYIELAEEERECLERAIFQEAYDIKDVDLKCRVKEKAKAKKEAPKKDVPKKENPNKENSGKEGLKKENPNKDASSKEKPKQKKIKEGEKK